MSMRFMNAHRNLSRSIMLILTLLVMSNVFANNQPDMQKVGEARLKVLFWTIYDSVFYTPSGRFQAGIYPQQLEITYRREIEATDLLQSTLEEWQKLGLEQQTIENWLLKLKPIFPDIKENDVLTLVVDTQRHSYFYFNSVLIGQIEDPLFGPAFLRIWLDENSSYPKVRNKLIGKSR